MDNSSMKSFKNGKLVLKKLYVSSKKKTENYLDKIVC